MEYYCYELTENEQDRDVIILEDGRMIVRRECSEKEYNNIAEQLDLWEYTIYNNKFVKEQGNKIDVRSCILEAGKVIAFRYYYNGEFYIISLEPQGRVYDLGIHKREYMTVDSQYREITHDYVRITLELEYLGKDKIDC